MQKFSQLIHSTRVYIKHEEINFRQIIKGDDIILCIFFTALSKMSCDESNKHIILLKSSIKDEWRYYIPICSTYSAFTLRLKLILFKIYEICNLARLVYQI